MRESHGDLIRRMRSAEREDLSFKASNYGIFTVESLLFLLKVTAEVAGHCQASRRLCHRARCSLLGRSHLLFTYSHQLSALLSACPVGINCNIHERPLCRRASI